MKYFFINRLVIFFSIIIHVELLVVLSLSGV